ncbi:hypothetical protein T06_1240 [Trichinella sp. T6]|nr:hypothetical protein T06_1240 [Trichinella sp. T6]
MLNSNDLHNITYAQLPVSGTVSSCFFWYIMNYFVESKCMLIFLLIFPNPITATSKCRTQDGGADTDWAILYKAAGRNDGRIITAENGAWRQSPQSIDNRDRNSFGKALEHVAVLDQSAKFVAYNNKPPNAVGVQTNSNSKGMYINNMQHKDMP